ncbi:MAG TPA: hypothetical protein VFY67_09065 [Pyrinomonadaceae bacterium]|nr:hypothetical protein [Pyrinomonadaceae bacterium]
MLPELGHINATLKLARSLAARGHDVYYLRGITLSLPADAGAEVSANSLYSDIKK